MKSKYIKKPPCVRGAVVVTLYIVVVFSKPKNRINKKNPPIDLVVFVAGDAECGAMDGRT